MDRRTFLRSLAASASIFSIAGCGRTSTQPAARPDADSSQRSPAASAEGAQRPPRARVVVVRSAAWKTNPQPNSLRQGLSAGIAALMGEAEDGWARLFKPSENIAIKVNCLAGPGLCTSPQLSEAVVDELAAAGHPRKRIWVFDRSTAELIECGYNISTDPDDVKCAGTDEVGYDEDVTIIGDTGTWFSLIVSQWADAMINMPVAKDHDLAGISGALKNHFGSIGNPNKLHLPDISQSIADVAAAPVIATKQRLIICDALRVAYDGGPGFKPATTARYGAILLSTDPVATDAVIISIIDKLRAEAGLEPLASRPTPPAHVQVAADEQHNLGCAALDEIDLVEVEV